MSFKPTMTDGKIVTSMSQLPPDEMTKIYNKYGDFPEELLEEFPVEKKDFLNRAETRLLKVFRHRFFKRDPMYSYECEIFPQVHLIQMIKIDDSNIDELIKKYETFFAGEDKRYALLNEIRMMSLDFVIANMNAIPLCVVELDGPTHKNENQKRRDKLKNACLKNAGVKLVRITIEEFSKEVSLQKKIDEVIATCVLEDSGIKTKKTKLLIDFLF